MIGGFPTWNLVEDLYSGYVAMQHGLQGAYIPIVGAIGQVSPEDIPNVYKQLGTWALDTVRIFVWKNPWFVQGLTFKQRMQFTELGLFYLMSFPLLIFTITPIISLFFGIHPFLSSNLDYILHFWPYAASIEILLAVLANNTKFEDIWRARQMWFGMMFVYMKAALLAIGYGPSKKPVYKVTRKVQQAGLYVRETLWQIVLFLLLLSAIIYNGIAHHNVLKNGDIGSMFWVLLYLLLLSGIIRRSWFGVKITLPARLLIPGHKLYQQDTLQGQILSVQQGTVSMRVRSQGLWQFLRFALVGTLNAFIDFGAFNLLLWLVPTHTNWHILGYNSLAVLLAATNSFFCNKYWTFQQAHTISRQEVFRFSLLALSTILLNDLLIWQFSTWLPTLMQTFAGSNALKLGAILGTTSISFFGMRLWVFLKRT
jgi:putative flippase GtrA